MQRRRGVAHVGLQHVEAKARKVALAFLSLPFLIPLHFLPPLALFPSRSSRFSSSSPTFLSSLPSLNICDTSTR
eukprot:2533668-Rhodomonas_salina.1